jgi:hypothetical protein
VKRRGQGGGQRERDGREQDLAGLGTLARLPQPIKNMRVVCARGVPGEEVVAPKGETRACAHPSPIRDTGRHSGRARGTGRASAARPASTQKATRGRTQRKANRQKKPREKIKKKRARRPHRSPFLPFSSSNSRPLPPRPAGAGRRWGASARAGNGRACVRWRGGGGRRGGAGKAAKAGRREEEEERGGLGAYSWCLGI